VSAAGHELEVAQRLSAAILSAAESGDMFALGMLDDQRRELLQSFRRRVRQLQPAEQRIIDEIATLNSLAIGAIEHQRRAKARELDMAAVGRRAVKSYARTNSG
jgi:hypothetical protein